jgi:hypothetical protein
MTRAEALERGRESVREQAWGAAFSHLLDADQQGPLQPEDIERLATAAHLIGKESESADLLARAHQGFLSGGDTHYGLASDCSIAVSLRRPEVG